ncbi:hypothetical protein EXIGLDRAFT_278525 [Exidia glandulosa HHB12029]|uniref:Uncharacterized protein n=1 Tax=Exidia glandulosa HHB12029 TaxID=1314781 RepID=A0A165ZPT2_EXIGL|nr:hypothetical protein EXIGLDRAFT_278525 [Exidia glandulosa HHB12029]
MATFRQMYMKTSSNGWRLPFAYRTSPPRTTTSSSRRRARSRPNRTLTDSTQPFKSTRKRVGRRVRGCTRPRDDRSHTATLGADTTPSCIYAGSCVRGPRFPRLGRRLYVARRIGYASGRYIGVPRRLRCLLALLYRPLLLPWPRLGLRYHMRTQRSKATANSFVSCVKTLNYDACSISLS